MAEPTVEEVKDFIFKNVESMQGKKKLKPMDLQKMVFEAYGADIEKRACKKLVKEAIKELINSGTLVYSYFGGSFVEMPPKEGEEK